MRAWTKGSPDLLPLLTAILLLACWLKSLDNYLRDNTQAWLMGADGRYERTSPGDEPAHSAQNHLLQILD